MEKSRIKWIAVLAFLFLFGKTGFCVEAPWSMFRHDIKRTGQSQHQGSQINTLKWKSAAGGFLGSSPAIGSDGTVYVGSDDGYLYAIGESTIVFNPYDPNGVGGTTMADVLICYKQYLGLPTVYPLADVDGGGG